MLPKLGHCVLAALERIDKAGAEHSERRAGITARIASAKDFLYGEKQKLSALLENDCPADLASKKAIAVQSGFNCYFNIIIHYH